MMDYDNDGLVCRLDNRPKEEDDNHNDKQTETTKARQCLGENRNNGTADKSDAAKDNNDKSTKQGREAGAPNNNHSKTTRKGRKNKKSMAKKNSTTNITILYTLSELDLFVNNNNNNATKPVLVEFVASWCGACQRIQPLYQQLAERYVDSVRVAQVVCDQNKETQKLAAAFQVQSYPVFVVLLPGDNDGGGGRSKQDRWDGADPGKLEKTMERLSVWEGGGSSGGTKRGRKAGKKKR